MELSNRDLVGKALELLAEGLQPFVARHVKGVAPGGMDWFDWLCRRPHRRGRGRTASKTDPLFLLQTIIKEREVFEGALPEDSRSDAQHLLEWRHRWAHNSMFNEASSRQVLETAERLLRVIGAIIEADRVQQILHEHRLATRMPEPRNDHGRGAAMPVTEPRLPADETSGGEGTGGAGRGRRRFTVTAIAAGIPVACTGILLMTANNPGQHGHASGNSPAATGASASPPAVSPGSSTGADALSLAELDGTGETPRRGAWPLQGQSCGHSLGYLNLTQQESVTYEFHHAYLHFSATVGFIGESQVAGIRHVGFKVWGVEKDGTRVPLPGGMKTIRSPSQIGNIYEKVSGYTGITLETFPEGTRLIKGQGPLAVWGCPELLVR